MINIVELYVLHKNVIHVTNQILDLHIFERLVSILEMYFFEGKHHQFMRVISFEYPANCHNMSKTVIYLSYVNIFKHLKRVI